MPSAVFQLTVNVSLLFPDRLALSIPQRLVYITSYLLFWQALLCCFALFFSDNGYILKVPADIPVGTV